VIIITIALFLSLSKLIGLLYLKSKSRRITTSSELLAHLIMILGYWLQFTLSSIGHIFIIVVHIFPCFTAFLKWWQNRKWFG